MSKIKSKAVKVKIKETEKVRKKLIESNTIDNNLRIYTKNGFSYIPITNEKYNDKILKSFDITTGCFLKNKQKFGSYKEAIVFSDKVKQYLPSSFDIIGDIALIKLDENVKQYKTEIGESIIKTNNNIRTVCMVEPVSGEYRTRDIKIIAGENKTKTTHKEFGLSFLVDIKKVYFSPRLANERKRISDMIRNNEIIVDMFTGVAPFPIMIAKYSNAKKVFAVDKNKDAIELAKINVRRNRVYDKIKLIHGDSKNVTDLISKEGNVKVDRIIMNLPFSSYEYFTHTANLMKKECILHYYEILKEDKINERIKSLKEIALNKNILLIDFNVNEIKSYSPREFYIGIDITAKRI